MIRDINSMFLVLRSGMGCIVEIRSALNVLNYPHGFIIQGGIHSLGENVWRHHFWRQQQHTQHEVTSYSQFSLPRHEAPRRTVARCTREIISLA
ncbi:hypothetical protein J6590_025915 [Homalodisca vitripennis]|nr:hypothetical protein J6590_025915 [Homalodisca vitripennis]